MRIGIFDPYLDDLGGGEKYMMTIASYLSLKNSVEVFWSFKSDIDKISERFNLDLSRVKVVRNVFNDRTSIFRKLLATRDYDALIFLSDGSIPITLSKKLFVHIQQPLEKLQKNSFKLSKVNAFFVNSNYTKDYLLKKFKIDAKVIYPPVDLITEKVNKENIILNVGRLRINKELKTDYKKQSVLIDAFKKMIDEGLKDWEFRLVISVSKGNTEDLQVLEKKTGNYPIKILVNKSNKDLAKEYAKAKIYWHASGFGENLEKHPELAEHFGISTVEAMSAGCVPVVINAGGQKEIVRNAQNGYLFDTLEELKSITIKLMENTSLMEDISKSAKSSVSKFAKENFEKEIDRLIYA